ELAQTLRPHQGRGASHPPRGPCGEQDADHHRRDPSTVGFSATSTLASPVPLLPDRLSSTPGSCFRAFPSRASGSARDVGGTHPSRTGTPRRTATISAI